MNNASVSSPTSDEDEVIKEIPIFNSKRLQNQLYLLQYPLIKKHATNNVTIRKGFFKPNNQELELEMAIDIQSKNFNLDEAKSTAYKVDGEAGTRKIGSKVFFENGLVDKVSLKSMKVVNDPSNYAAFTYTGKEIHLTTLQNIFQLRPSFTYLDNTRKKKDVDHNDCTDEDDAGPSTAQAVSVKFKRGDDRFKKPKTNVDETYEEWSSCDVYTEDSSLSKIEKLKLMTENTLETSQAMSLSNSEYLRLLVPEDPGRTAKTEPSNPSHMSLHTLRLLPILEQCRTLLKDAQIIQFQQLLMILSGGEGLSAETLLRNLPKVAILVRGNWIVKSEVVYPEKTLSSTSGIPAEVMWRARDYVLYLFTKNQYVERKKVSSVMKIPSEEVKEIFVGFSKQKHYKGWELQLPTDYDFIQKYSDIVQKQSDAWEQKWKHITQFLKDNQRQRRKSKSVSEDSKTRNGTNCVSSDNDSGTEKNKSPMFPRKNKNA